MYYIIMGLDLQSRNSLACGQRRFEGLGWANVFNLQEFRGYVQRHPLLSFASRDSPILLD